MQLHLSTPPLLNQALTLSTSHPLLVKLPKGGPLTCTHVLHYARIRIDTLTFHDSFYVLSMEGLEVVLGKPWLNKYNPDIDWPTNSMVIKTPNQEHFLVGGTIKKRHHDPVTLNFISRAFPRSERLTMPLTSNPMGRCPTCQRTG